MKNDLINHDYSSSEERISACYNKRCEEWLFTWGYGQQYPNKFVRIQGSMSDARAEMFRRYGSKWCFQYPASKEPELLKHGITELI